MQFWPRRALRVPSPEARAAGQRAHRLTTTIHLLAAALAAVAALAAPALAQTADDDFLFEDEEEAGVAPTEAEAQTEAQAEISDDAALATEPPEERGARRRGIEELKVTGRKREELLQEIPTSVRAFSSEEIMQRNIQRIDEIGLATANLQFTGANGSSRDSRIYIRGIGQSDTRSIVDPGVGLYIDNVYIPRSTAAIFDVLDFERIDIKRGPQGTLFGKNTVGGLVNLITTKPGQELGGDLRVNVGTFDMLETRVSVDIPIRAGWFDEKLFTRWTIATATDDGYLTNVYDGGEAGDNKLLAGRFAGTLLPSEGVTISTTFDWMRQNENAMVGRCRIAGQESAFPAIRPEPGQEGYLSYGPYVIARYVADNFTQRDDFANPPGYVEGEEYRFPEACAGVNTLDRYDGYANPLAFLRQDTYGASLDVAWNVSDASLPDWLAIDVRSVNGFRYRKEDNSPSDFDGTPVEYVELGAIPGHHYAVSSDLTAVFEFETPSPDVSVRLITGAFGFYENGHDGAFGDINRAMSLGTNPDFNQETFDTSVLATVVDALGQTQLTDPTYDGDTWVRDALRYGNSLLNTETERDWNTLSIAGYAHAEVELFEDWSVSGGLRYTWERKQRDGRSQRLLCGAYIGDTSITDPTDPNFDASQFEVLPIPGVEALEDGIPIIGGPDRVCGANEVVPAVIVPQEDTWGRLTPEAGVKYQINDDMMSYFRYAQGWKSGGFNREALTERRSDFVDENEGSEDFGFPPTNTFEPEVVNSYEVGYKSTWLDNQLLVNVALFWNDYQDMQLTTIEPDENGLVSANVRNAADAVTRGLELEATAIPDWEWLPGPEAQLILTGGLGFTDAFYKDYRAVIQDSVRPINPSCTSLRRGQNPSDQPAGFCDSEIDAFVDATIISAVLGNTNEPVLVDRSDNQFANVPAFNFNISAIYSFEIQEVTIATNVRYYYQTEIYFNVDNSPNLYQPAYGFLDGSLAFVVEATDTRVELWGKNLTDTKFNQGGFSFGPALGADGVYVGRPRSFGMTLTQRFY